MTLYEGLEEVNAQIRELEKKRAEIINRNNDLNEEDIKTLEWTKDCIARLRINAFYQPNYEIIVYGKKLPQTGCKSVTILGNSKNCYSNLIYSYCVDYGVFSTSSEKILVQFLEQVQFEKLEYNKQHLVALKAAEKANQRYEETRQNS